MSATNETTQETLTKEQFEEGKYFMYNTNGEVLRFVKREKSPNGSVGRIEVWTPYGDKYFCNVGKIDDDGFHFFLFVLSAFVEGKALYKDCQLSNFIYIKNKP